jgi:hypothetical protein
MFELLKFKKFFIVTDASYAASRYGFLKWDAKNIDGKHSEKNISKSSKRFCVYPEKFKNV